MQHLSHIAETVIPSERVNAVADDPDNNAIIECAVAGEANVIVSGDRHLFSLGQFGGIKIMKVPTFWRQLSELLLKNHSIRDVHHFLIGFRRQKPSLNVEGVLHPIRSENYRMSNLMTERKWRKG